MEIRFSGMLLVSAAGIVFALMCAGIWSKFGGFNKGAERFKAFFKAFLVCQGTLILVGNLLMVGISWLTTRAESRTEKVGAPVCDVIQELGLTSGMPYRMSLGSRDGEYYRVAFKTPTGDVPIKLPLKGSSFPTDAIGQEKPTVTITLKCNKRVPATQVVHLAAPRWQLDSGFISLVQDETDRDKAVPDSKYTKKGLAALVTKYFKSAEIHLTEAEYEDKILG